MCTAIGNLFRLVIVCGVAFAVAMQFLNRSSCDFIHTSDGSMNIGIWYLGSDGECNMEEGYEPPEEDSYVQWARSASVISMIAGIATGGMVLFEWVLCQIPCASCLEGAGFVVAWACGLGTYLMYGIDGCGTVGDKMTDDIVGNIGSTVIPDSIESIPTGAGCDWGQGATYNLLACIAYFGCGFLLCCAPEPKPLCQQ